MCALSRSRGYTARFTAKRKAPEQKKIIVWGNNGLSMNLPTGITHTSQNATEGSLQVLFSLIGSKYGFRNQVSIDRIPARPGECQRSFRGRVSPAQ
jgi:hypothetical protein